MLHLPSRDWEALITPIPRVLEPQQYIELYSTHEVCQENMFKSQQYCLWGQRFYFDKNTPSKHYSKAFKCL